MTLKNLHQGCSQRGDKDPEDPEILSLLTDFSHISLIEYLHRFPIPYPLEKKPGYAPDLHLNFCQIV